tara:strand:- start:100 stop:498 length:399 start_codon:yes stop_codon:yes gene_type:complete
MKKNSAFKLRSGNKPSIAKMFGMMKTFKENMQRLKDERAKRKANKIKKDPLTKNILDTSQKGDEALRHTVSNKPIKPKPKKTYREAFGAMKIDPTGSTRIDKFGNIYENTPRGFADFKKAASNYNKLQKSKK